MTDKVNETGVAGPPLPIEAGDLVFVPGQASEDDKGNIVSATFEEEMRRAMDNVETVLTSMNLTLVDVVRVTGYVRDPDNRGIYIDIYRDYFSEPYPARTTLTAAYRTSSTSRSMWLPTADPRQHGRAKTQALRSS